MRKWLIVLRSTRSYFGNPRLKKKIEETHKNLEELQRRDQELLNPMQGSELSKES